MGFRGLQAHPHRTEEPPRRVRVRDPGTDRTASEFPAKGAGNPWQSCQSPERARLMRRDYAKTLSCAALLFALNAYITPLLFHTAYTAEMGSIEAAFIGLARYASQH